MLQRIPLENILFLDIETVPEQASYSELSEEARELWEQKTRFQRKEEFTGEEFYERAGIWAEFGKVICISAGYFQPGERLFRLRSFTGTEPELLSEFSKLLGGYFGRRNRMLCAHNGKEFDFPYLARRMIIHGIPLPDKLNLFGKKPWEVPHLDTMELWKFGDFKHYTSLRLLAHILGIPSPKEDLDGSKIRSVYYEEGDMERIVKYCELDVVTTAQIFLRFRGEELLGQGQIVHV
ncbi:3'-5' exonuclease [Robiginitalea sediminis]|uniref:3'-5' exonuclease n=1 Tax=Robiginitalea sediminis TaxID=1982593 RepID=UPI000B4B106D|nr:3'-5' exonuclease [Robiginitalea sediminis]